MERVLGAQVLVTAYNSEKYLQESLNSILPAVDGIPWVFILTSDGSTDSTFDIAKKFASTCGADITIVKQLKKSSNIAKAKNRTFKYINKHRDRYPYICVHDSDDIMGTDRIRGLSTELVAQNVPFVYGSFEYIGPDLRRTYSGHKLGHALKFGIWNTLFHEQLVPLNGKFFNETVHAFEDLIKWWDLKYKDKIQMGCVPDVITTHYIKREQSMTKMPQDMDAVNRMKYLRNKVHPYPPH